MEVYQYQDNGILEEFKGLTAVAIQEKCKNLKFSCQFLQGKRILNTLKINTKQSIVFKNLKKH